MSTFIPPGAAPPGGGTPGGTSGQMQFNNAGALAGVAGSTVDLATGNTTFSARWIQSTNSAASAPATALTGTWFTGGTTTTTKPHFLIEPAGTISTAWSTAGTGLGVNAPSGFSGILMDLQINGVSYLRVSPYGTIVFNNSSGAQLEPATNGCFFKVFSSVAAGWTTSTFQMSAGTTFGFNSGNPTQGTYDLQVARDAADSWAQRRGTSPQAFRLYNTFTSATNFERLNFRWTSNEAIIDTEAGSGGGTLRGLRIGSAATSLLGFYNATPVAQPAAVADATDAATVITQLNALLARIRTLGLIAT